MEDEENQHIIERLKFTLKLLNEWILDRKDTIPPREMMLAFLTTALDIGYVHSNMDRNQFENTLLVIIKKHIDSLYKVGKTEIVKKHIDNPYKIPEINYIENK
jgi:hypothetical protein